MHFDNLKDHSLREIWQKSEAFQKFRGEEWMPEPCKSCDRRTRDFGGCRCQAFLLTGDATATDPVCTLAPQHSKVDAVLAAANGASAESFVKPNWLYRPNPA
jgi:pyrroloquinoline quinone biosynthesis protein E